MTAPAEDKSKPRDTNEGPVSIPVPPSTRRLAAVLIADVAGYSRLMERDESGTHERLLQIRREVTDPAVLRHGGRIVRTVGDGLLVEFHSAMSALLAAIEIQREMAQRNAALSPAARIDHRIGINLGDIIIESNDIAGNGVNVAARLEVLAPPGGIAVSGTVRDQVRQDLGVTFVDAGVQHVKNISRPIRVFSVQLDGGKRRNWRAWLRRPRRVQWAAGLIVAVLVAGIAWTWVQRAHDSSALPSLIVLPFEAAPGTEPIASSLTSQITNAVSRISGLSVMSQTMAQRYTTHPADIRRIGDELNVRYALEGRVVSSGDRLRITAALVAADSGKTVWSGDLETRRPADDTAPLDAIGRVAETVRTELRAAEIRRLGPANDSAQALALRATTGLPNAANLAELRSVRAMFERSLQQDGQHVLAMIGLADTLAFESQRVAAESERDELLARADNVSLRVVSLEPNNAEAWATRAQVLMFREQFEAAGESIERAVRLNPYISDLHALRAQVLMAQGLAAESVAELDHAQALNPRGNAMGVLLHYRCRAQLMLANYDNAIENCQRGLAFLPDWPDYMLLVAAYAMKDDMKRARAAKAELMRLHPTFSIGWHATVSGPARAAQFEKFVYPGLRKAGVPE